MPRRRAKDRQQLPKYVYRSKGRYVYREYLGVENGRARFGPDRPLCCVDAPIAEVWEAYHALTAGTRANTLGWLFDSYPASAEFRALAESTRKMYERNAHTIRKTRIRGGHDFGDVTLKQLTRGVFRKYMDKRSQSGAPVQSNRELSFMKTAFRWALERDIIRENPVAAVKKNKEKPRDRYINDAEYKLVYDLAPPMVKCAMELAYLCRARLIEVRGFKRSDTTEDGLLIKRAKGSRTQLIKWTPRLRKAVEMGRQANGKVMTMDPYILNRKSGGQITDSGFKTAWQRIMAKAQKKGLSDRFTFHDIKAKGVSDFDGDKTKASGHKSPRMAAVYYRRLETIDATK